MTKDLKNYFFKHRTNIYIILISIVLAAYAVSYALLSISTFLLILFFFLDTHDNLKIKWQKVRSNKIILLYVLYFVTQCIGLVYSENIEYGLRRVNTTLPTLFLPAIIYTEPLNKDLFYKVLKLLKLYILLVFSVFLFIHLAIDGRSLNVFALYMLNEKLGISQFYMLFVLIIPLIFTLNEMIKKQDLLYNAICLVALLFYVFLLSNKTAVFMMMLIFLIKFIDHYKNKSLYFKLGILVVTPLIFGLLAYNTVGVKQKFDVLLKSTDFDIEIIKTKNKVTYTKNTLEHRILINYLSFEELSKNLPFGVGTGDYQDVLNQRYNDVHFKLGMKQQFNNHNQYISEALKTGILGISIFTVLLIYLFKAAIHKNNYYFVVLLLFSLGCFFESYLDRQHGVIIFSFIIPLLYVYENQID